MSSPNLLPDSRLLHRPDLGTVLVDWPLAGGGTARVEVAMVYCANCGKEHGWVPKENTTFAFWLCVQCFEDYGEVAGTFAQPDDQFCRDVQHEMEERFGRGLTVAEIEYVVDRGLLGSALEKLTKESPWKVRNM